MVYCHVTVLGGLPVIADVWFSGPDYQGEYDSGVNTLYWTKHDGTLGSPLSQKVMDRIERQDDLWEAYVTEQANEWLGANCPIKYADGETVGDWSEDYIQLNGTPKEG